MAKKILTDLDLNGNKLQNTLIESLDSFPATSSREQGRVIYKEGKFYYSDGTNWVNLQKALVAGNGIAIDPSEVIRTTGIPFGVCDSTSTSTAYTVTVPGIYKLEDGVCCIIKNGVVTSESGFTLNVNGLGAKPSYSNMATGNDVTPTDPTRDTTIFNINYAMLFIYSSTIVDGGGWICYRGYDANTNTIGYQVRSNSQSLPASQKFYRYRLLFTSADGTHYVPANTSSSTNATSSRTVNQTPIDPFGHITYYGTTAAVEANARPAASSLWIIYTLNLGYSFNRTGAALTLSSWAPVYVKCAPQSNGSAIIDADHPYVQALPTTNDGKIYIFLGIAYSATNIELLNNHPIYYHDGTGIKLWIGGASSSVGALNTDNSTTLPVSASESFGSNINLHKISKTGSYNDILDKPIYLVTLTAGNNNQITSDKTYDEIYAAIQANKEVIAVVSHTLSESYSVRQSYRYSSYVSLFDVGVIGFIAQSTSIDWYGIDILGCQKSGNETTWHGATIPLTKGVSVGSSYYDTNIVDGYINLTNVIPSQSDIDAAKPLIVTAEFFSTDPPTPNPDFTCDTSNADIYAAWQAGRNILLDSGEYGVLQLKTPVTDINTAFFIGVLYDDPHSHVIAEISTFENTQMGFVDFYNNQPELTFDNIPTQNSNNPVKSGGVYSALQGKEDKCLIVTFTKNNDVYSADKTFTQIATASSNGIKVFGVLEYELYNLVYCEDEAIFQSNFENSFSTLVVGGNYVEYHQGEFVKYKQYSNVTNLNADDPATGTIGFIISTGVFYIYEGGSQEWKKLIVDSDLSSYVPTSRTINGKALTTNITLNASDVGANVFVVNIESDDNDVYTCDKTNAEIYAAWQAGRNIVAIMGNELMFPLSSSPSVNAVNFSGAFYDEINSNCAITISTYNNSQNVVVNTFYGVSDNYACADITSTDITNWNNKQSPIGIIDLT